MKKKIQPELLLGLALFALTFLLNLRVLPRDFLTYRDSLELVTTSHLLQAAHPPGYPLFNLLGKLLTLPLFWIPSIYTRYAVVNSLYGAGTVLLFYFVGLRLTKKKVLSALFALTLAWSYTFWFYSILPEVFMLACLSLMASLWLLLRWKTAFEEKDPRAGRYWAWFGASLGLGLVCHQITILWWPGFALILLLTAGRRWFELTIALAGPFLLGLTPTLLVLLQGMLPHRPLWGNTPDLRGWLHYLLRGDYGGIGSTGVNVRSGFEGVGVSLRSLGRHMGVNFGPGWLLLLGGGLALKKAKFLLFLPLTAVIAGPLFFAYARFEGNSDFYLGTSEAMALPFFIALFLFALVLSNDLLDRCPPPASRWVLALAGVAVAAQLGFSLPRVDHSKERLSGLYRQNFVDSLPKGVVLLTWADRDMFVAIYEGWAKRSRPDLSLINHGFLEKPAYHAELARAYPDLSINSALNSNLFMRRFIRDNLGKRPIFVTTARFAEVWGCEGNPFFLRPTGGYFEVVKDSRALATGSLDLSVVPEVARESRSIPTSDYWERELADGFRLGFERSSTIYSNLGLFRKAAECYEALLILDPENPNWIAQKALAENRQDTFLGNKKWQAQSPSEEEALAMVAVRAGDYDRAILHLEYAFQGDPRRASCANKLAVILASQKDFVSALPFALQATLAEPENQKYQDDLAYVREHQ